MELLERETENLAQLLILSYTEAFGKHQASITYLRETIELFKSDGFQ